MVYYVVDSCHEGCSGEVRGHMYLEELQGESIPKNRYDSIPNGGFTRQDYFSTYEEAKEHFQYNFRDYLNPQNYRYKIDTWDTIADDRVTTNDY